jgi:hypothetical protein
VHPALQIGIVRGVDPVPPEAAAHAIVDRVDAGSGRDHLLHVAERDRLHRADGRAQPPEAGEQAAAKGAVIMYAGGDRGMRELEQDGTAPSGYDDDLAVDLPGDAVGSAAHGLRSEQARADRRAMEVHTGHM